MTAYRSKTTNESGKRSLVFNPQLALQQDDPMEISCGQCVGCRLERSRQWAIRCIHEASTHEDNCFITLTFNQESLEKRKFPESLDVRDFQLFMKRLRKKYGKKIRFFHCGEYGDHNNRPHYHACLFNFDFPDKKLWKQSDGNNLYISESLSQLWPDGFSTIGDVTFESAAYVARYIMKKVTGSQSEQHYEHITTDGEIKQLKPEYTTMSRRPGIGKAWYDKYKRDLYPSDFITVNSKKCRVPKYYDAQLEKQNLSLYESIKEKRETSIDQNHPDLTTERLETREKIIKRKSKQLVRTHDLPESK